MEKDYLLNGLNAIKPLNGNALYKGESYEEPNLVLENSNLGRGNFFYDNDTMRHFEICTKTIAKWKINENTFDDVDVSTYPHFYSNQSYIIKWVYQISVTVRELSGKVSNRYITVGRDRCVYFCWQGKNASTKEKRSSWHFSKVLDSAEESAYNGMINGPRIG